jgi:hypothetical protein
MTVNQWKPCATGPYRSKCVLIAVDIVRTPIGSRLRCGLQL